MMTPTHLLIASSLFTKPGQTKRNIAIVAGALIPDFAIYILFFYALATGISQETLWNETYWSASWQPWVTIGNSAPLYAGLLLLSLAIAAPKDGRARWQSLPALFALAALTHLAGDLPVHNGDAHIHFWPITDWRFHSPVSYWDADHHAGILQPLECILGFALSIFLYRRFAQRPIRFLPGLVGLAYLALLVIIITT